MAKRISLKDEWKFGTEDTPDKQSLPVELITLRANQPRRYFDPEKLRQLTESIRQHGVLEPILVRPLKKVGIYELVAGERRLRAAQEVGLTSIPVVIRDLDDEEALQLALVENLQRENLNPVEEAEGVLELLALRLNIPSIDVPPLLYKMRNEAIGKVNQNVLINSEAQAVQAVFTELGTVSWESFVTTRLPLLRLPPEILEALQKGEIAYTKAQIIARIKDKEQRDSLLQQAISDDLSLSEIKTRIKEIKPESEPTPKKLVAQRWSEIGKRLQKSEVWSDRKRRNRITKLLDELDQLTTLITDKNIG